MGGWAFLGCVADVPPLPFSFSFFPARSFRAFSFSRGFGFSCCAVGGLVCFLLVLGFFFSALLAVLPRAAHLWWAARGEYLPGGVLGGGVGFLGVGCDYAGPLQSGHLLFPSCALCRTSVFGGVFWSTDSCVCVCVHVSDSLIVGGERRSVEDGGRPFGGGGGGKIVKISQIPCQILVRTFQNE